MLCTAACRTASGYWETSDSVFVSLAKAQPSGMLLAYHPDNRSTIALMNDLWFANGVALAHDESFVLVADSVQMKIRRYALCNMVCTPHHSVFSHVL